MSGAFKVGKRRFADIKEKIRKRIIREKGLTYKQAMEEELLEWQKNEGSKGGMVAAIVEKDIQRELADVVSTETYVFKCFNLTATILSLTNLSVGRL